MQINKLIIYSPDVKRQEHFYNAGMGIKQSNKSGNELQFKIGTTLLVIKNKVNATPYHFAINIPSDAIKKAVQFLKEKNIRILMDGENEIINFSNWNAESVYFHDADNNIVELIARKNLEISSGEKFDSESFLCISEIGVPVNDLEQSFQQLNSFISIPVYWGNFDRFCATGDEHGLFIMIDKNKKDWFPTGEKAFPSPFLIDCGKKLEFNDGQFSMLNS